MGFSLTTKAARVSNTIMSIINRLDGKIMQWIQMSALRCTYWTYSLFDRSASISKLLGAYVREHYPSLPAYAVYPSLPTDADQESYTIIIVGNKYNNSNFWCLHLTAFVDVRNGRWRSIYKYNPHARTLKGTVTILVHYFEDGNVMLKTDHPVDKSDLSSQSALIKVIADDEKSYQEELNRTFAGLGDGAFKGLRRLLPVTKQKIEWEKVASYKIKPGQK